MQNKCLIEIAVNGFPCLAAVARRAPGLEGVVYGGEVLPNRLQGDGRVDTGSQHQEDAVPVKVVLGSPPVHAQGQKDVRDRPFFGSGKIARTDADDFNCLVADVERAAQNFGIATQAMIPIVPRENRIRIATGHAVIGWGKQAAKCGFKSEYREHVARDIRDVSFLYVLVRGPGDVRAISVTNGNKIGLILNGIAHQVELRRGPVAAIDRLALEPDHFAREDIEPAGPGDRQRAPEQGVDKTEGSDARADAERERKHSGRGRDLIAGELPPAETYIGENRFKPSGNTNAVARFAGAQRRTECAARFVGIAS